MLDMKKSSQLAVVGTLLLFFVGTACHHGGSAGKGRPPVVGSTTSAPTSGDYGSHSSNSGNYGADIRPIDPNGGTSGNLGPTDPMNGEGGPLADIRFEYDSAALTPTALQTLTAHAAWLKDRRGQHVTLEGHCDERGTVQYNLALGEQRAKAVYDHLAELGVPAAQLQTVSLGKERPLDTDHTEEAFAKNRRVHFAVQN
jgi:peptidoglycan-associated lipoprotein